MKTSSQRIICFVVVLLGVAYFIPAMGQGNAMPVWEKNFRELNLPGNMLKNENNGFLARAAFIDFSGYRAMISESRNVLSEKLNPFNFYSGTFISENPNSTTEKIIPSNIYYCQSGFFCKREWQLEKTTHIPFRFRLGSLDYCNALEKKH